jgi:hypothetical protein
MEQVEAFVLVQKIDEIRSKFESLTGTLKRKLLKSYREIGQVGRLHLSLTLTSVSVSLSVSLT